MATGGAIPGHRLFQPLAACSRSTGGAVPLDRSDPYHSDPGSEFIRIEAAYTGGTASASFNILGHIGWPYLIPASSDPAA